MNMDDDDESMQIERFTEEKEESNPYPPQPTRIQQLILLFQAELRLVQDMDPFHLYLLATIDPEKFLPVLGYGSIHEILDPAILTDLQETNAPKAYWRVLYVTEFVRRHNAWPRGFKSIHKPMRHWYKHLDDVLKHRTVQLDMDFFPLSHVPGTRSHPMEILAAYLIFHVLVVHAPQIEIQWPNDPKNRTLQAVLMQCIRQGKAGFDLFLGRLQMPLVQIEPFQSALMQWLVNETEYFSTALVEVDQWMDVLKIPKEWIAPALLVQGRIDHLSDTQLGQVLSRFITHDTSLSVKPRPVWIDHPRVRAVFARLDKEKANSIEWANVLVQNMRQVQYAERNDIIDLLVSIPELDGFVMGALTLAVTKMAIK